MPSSSDRPPTAIVFDLDDTLYLERDYVESGIEAVGRWLAATRGIRGFAAVAHALFADGRRTLLFDATFAALGVDPGPDLVARVVYEYRKHRPAIALAPDAARFLKEPRDVALAIVTDGSALSQRMKAAALKLRDRAITPIIFTDDWGRSFWKPHLRAFQQVETALGPHHGFIYVADNPVKDFIAPRRLGWRTIQIERPERMHRAPPPSDGHRADLTICSLDELRCAIPRLRARDGELCGMR